MKLNGKVVDIAALATELEAAGIPILELGTADDEVFTYDEDGTILDLPPAAAAVIAAHVLPEIVTKNDLLLLLLADVVPGEEDTEVLTLVLQEMLRP